MSLLLKANHIKKEYQDRLILKDVNFHIVTGECVGIVGNNGAGKTTLVNIIADDISMDDGQLMWHDKTHTIGYLRQSSYYTEESFNALVNAHDASHIQNFFETSHKLGMDTTMDMNQTRLSKLSGGEKTKLVLSQIWATNPSVLILDEPTNHMDYDGVQWLIKALHQFVGTVILISHDRYFMDQVCQRIIEIEEGLTTSYKGNYTAYYEEKKFRRESQLRQYQEEEKYRKALDRDIKQLHEWAEKGHRDSTKKQKNSTSSKMGLKEKFRARAKKKDKAVKSRVKKLEKSRVEGVVKPKEEQTITFHFNPTSKSAKVLEADNLAMTFHDKVLFSNSSFYVKSGEKIALFGKNGCGKTTLIKLILDEIVPTSGHLRVNPNLKVAYLSQDVGDMDKDLRVVEYFSYHNNKEQGLTRTLLTNMGFTKKMMVTKVKDLSVGEKTRLKIASMVLSDNNILILDEPTNHLDLHTREMLEKTLSDYNGTIIMVSHDRYLLEKLCDKVLYFKDNRIMRSEYTFKAYMTRKETKSIPQEQIDQDLTKRRMIIENRITTILGELSHLASDSEAYQNLDKEFKRLIKEKQSLNP
ncbi:ABC-F type ribosomal protection protein [Vallitalea pronyensis]|uniref:ABC-F type ribosomal protection protein n=1 Tax=Vallitalea pronyensis TaxID=1348613 RepID=A0A8J8SFF1_9FIRM|nr:ABC-F type ribosomal protection protein [Vallitalea pronyensis]QUI21193.1 ABC-F type ribosomal protection protein [Vallitalea pronyensis]